MNSSRPSYPNINFLKNFFWATGGCLSLAIFAILLGTWQTGSNLIKMTVSIFKPLATNPRVDVSRQIVRQVRGARELTTTVFVMDAVVPASSQRKLGAWVVGETKLLYLARGEVKAGVDLSKIEQGDVKIEGNRLEIQLPPPEILDRKIDVNHSQVYDYDRGFLNLGPDVAPQLQGEAQRQTLSKILEAACTQGILEQANQEAKLALSQLLETSGYERVTLITHRGVDCH